MIMKKELTQTELHRILCYNPLSGNFGWRVSLGSVQADSIAGCVKRDRFGKLYRGIWIHGCSYRASRLAFFYMRGYWPQNQMDHKDGDGLNNRWLNLRECTRSQNGANRHGPQKNNKLGIKGVSLHVKSGKYRAGIKVHGKQIYLGRYGTSEAAARAYWKAAEKYFGQFAAT